MVMPSDISMIYLLGLYYGAYLIEAAEIKGSEFSAFWLL